MDDDATNNNYATFDGDVATGADDREFGSFT